MLMTSTYDAAESSGASATAHLARFAAMLERRRGVIISTTVAGFVLAALYLLVAAPVYTSRSVLYVDPNPNRVVDGAASAPDTTGADLAIVDGQISIIRSNAILRRAVDNLGLDQDSSFASSGPLTRLRAFFSGEAAAHEAAKAAATETLSKRVKILHARESSIIEVEVSAGSPANAARINDTLVGFYLADQSAAARAEDARRTRIATSEGGAVDPQQPGALDGELIAARTATAETWARLDAVRAALEPGASLDVIPAAARSARLQWLREQLAQAARSEALLATQLKFRHPDLIDARSRLSALKLRIDAELHRIARALDSEYETATNRQREIERLIEQE
jgi:uncharacterized protein involved in exopolysaccharide biosynthesis